MRAVNLLPADRRGARRGSSFASLRRHALIVVAALLVVASIAGVALETRSATSKVSARQATLRTLDARVAKLPKPSTRPAPSASSQASKLTVATSVAGQRTTWDGFLGAVSRVIPEDVWLLDLSASTTGTTATASTTPAPVSSGAAPTGFTITGYTYSQPSVARLMRRLRLVPWLDGVALSTSSKTTLNNRIVYQFTVGANVISSPEVRP